LIYLPASRVPAITPKAWNAMTYPDSRDEYFKVNWSKKGITNRVILAASAPKNMTAAHNLKFR
ncbi:hypothetical protein MXM31_25645, partial [Klebsiella aerogenes]|uniref:hypothetical protein n=1 Tax=Klebsiella aerogenes TaxID=548 RepID=UPI002DBEB4BA